MEIKKTDKTFEIIYTDAEIEENERNWEEWIAEAEAEKAAEAETRRQADEYMARTYPQYYGSHNA